MQYKDTELTIQISYPKEDEWGWGEIKIDKSCHAYFYDNIRFEPKGSKGHAGMINFSEKELHIGNSVAVTGSSNSSDYINIPSTYEIRVKVKVDIDQDPCLMFSAITHGNCHLAILANDELLCRLPPNESSDLISLVTFEQYNGLTVGPCLDSKQDVQLKPIKEDKMEIDQTSEESAEELAAKRAAILKRQEYHLVKCGYTNNQITFFGLPSVKLKEFQNNPTLFKTSLDAKALYCVSKDDYKRDQKKHDEKASEAFKTFYTYMERHIRY